MNTLKDTFRIYFQTLLGALAPAMSLPKARFDLQAMVWRYVLSLSFQLDRLITRWKNGTLPKPRGPGAPRPPRAAREPTAARTPPRFPLPRGRKWLLRRMPNSGIGNFGGQLAHLLANNAELAALLEASPQARRMLGPLCRAFGINMDNPLGIPPAQPPASPSPTPAPVATPPQAPRPPAESASPATIPAPTAPVSFSRC